MKLWMDVMRDLEHIMVDHARLFAAWEEGGVDGLVLGPLFFDQPKLLPGTRYEQTRTPLATFAPDPAVYRRFDVALPEGPVGPTAQQAALEEMLIAAKDRGWSVWLFQPSAGAGPDARGHVLADATTQRALAARTVDALQHYPMVDGAIMDGPEWGYEIAPHHQNHRSYIFHDLPETVRPLAAALGYDYDALVAAKDRLFTTLHTLQPGRVAHLAAGGALGGLTLLGRDPDLVAWLRFRVESLTAFFQTMRNAVDGELPQRVKLGVGPRSAAFAPLCGYDMARLATILDILLPKHYFFQRGFDGMVGTIYRYVETLTHWNPGLADADALAVVHALFGLTLPGVHDRDDLESALTPEFYAQIVAQETRAALAAVDDPERIVPWVDSGRAPHDGDPMSARDLRLLMEHAEAAGLRRFLYHHHGNLTPGEWAVISRHCGKPWRPLESSYRPPDMLVL
jgi:hypothetical protein